MSSIRGIGGVSQKMTNDDRGRGVWAILSKKSDVALHSRGEKGVSQKVTKGDRGEEGVRLI